MSMLCPKYPYIGMARVHLAYPTMNTLGLLPRNRSSIPRTGGRFKAARLAGDTHSVVTLPSHLPN